MVIIINTVIKLLTIFQVIGFSTAPFQKKIKVIVLRGVKQNTRYQKLKFKNKEVKYIKAI